MMMSDPNPQTPLAGAIGPDRVHRLVARVYYADTDFSGAVYHARYLEFLERGRSDFLRCVGIRHTALAEGFMGEPHFWVVRRMEIDFRRAARVDDILTIETRTHELGGARVIMGQRLLRGADKVLIEAKVTAALINEAGKPRRFPQGWLQLFRPAAAPES